MNSGIQLQHDVMAELDWEPSVRSSHVSLEAEDGTLTAGPAVARRVYDAGMPEMDYSARMTHLKLENDAVRAKLEDLQSMMGDASNKAHQPTL